MGKLIWSAYPVTGGHIVKAVDGHYGVCWGLPTGEPLVSAIEAIYAEHKRKATRLDGVPAYRAEFPDGGRALHQGASAGALSGDMASGTDSVRENRRAKFETAMAAKGLSLLDHKTSRYRPEIQCAWMAWNAALDSVCVQLNTFKLFHELPYVARNSISAIRRMDIAAIEAAGILCEVAK